MMSLDQVPNGEHFCYMNMGSRTDRSRVVGDARSFLAEKIGGTPIQYVTTRKLLGRYGIFLARKELRQ